MADGFHGCYQDQQRHFRNIVHAALICSTLCPASEVVPVVVMPSGHVTLNRAVQDIPYFHNTMKLLWNNEDSSTAEQFNLSPYENSSSPPAVFRIIGIIPHHEQKPDPVQYNFMVESRLPFSIISYWKSSNSNNNNLTAYISYGKILA